MYKTLLTTLAIIASPTMALAEDFKADHTYTQVNFSAELRQEAELRHSVSESTYEIVVHGDSYDDRQEVFDRALNKAAKKTLKKGYEWFRVVDKEIERDVQTRRTASYGSSFHTAPVRNCGLLTCTTRTRTYYTASAGADRPERRSVAYTVILEVELGQGFVRNPKNVYDAERIRMANRW